MSNIIYQLNNILSNGKLEAEKIEQIKKAIAAFNNNKVIDYLIANKCSHTGNYQDDVYHLLIHLDQVILGAGIEPISDRDIAQAFYDSVDAVKYGNCIADYVNASETNNLTILYDRIFDRLLVTIKDDYLAEIENVKAIASEIENLISTGVIDWEEWDNQSFPLRLQKCGNSLQLFYGTPDFDSSHAGVWGYYEIQPGNTDFLSYAIDMYDQCLGMEGENANS